MEKGLVVLEGLKNQKKGEYLRRCQDKANRLGRPLTKEEKSKIRHKVTHDFRTRLAIKTGALALAGFTLFSTGKMLGEGSGKIEGVTQENPKSVIVDANQFRESIKVVGLGDDGVLLVQDENGQDVQITNQNISDIKTQNDLSAQREAQIQQINEDIKSIDSKEDVLEYIKKFYKGQYAKNNGKEIAGNITIEFSNKNSLADEEIVVKKANGEVIEFWNGKNNEDTTLNKISGILFQMEDLREYYRNGSQDSYLSRQGGEKDKLIQAVLRANGLDENQKSEGMEPGE